MYFKLSIQNHIKIVSEHFGAKQVAPAPRPLPPDSRGHGATRTEEDGSKPRGPDRPSGATNFPRGGGVRGGVRDIFSTGYLFFFNFKKASDE